MLFIIASIQASRNDQAHMNHESHETFCIWVASLILQPSLLRTRIERHGHHIWWLGHLLDTTTLWCGQHVTWSSLSPEVQCSTLSKWAFKISVAPDPCGRDVKETEQGHHHNVPLLGHLRCIVPQAEGKTRETNCLTPPIICKICQETPPWIHWAPAKLGSSTWPTATNERLSSF